MWVTHSTKEMRSEHCEDTNKGQLYTRSADYATVSGTGTSGTEEAVNVRLCAFLYMWYFPKDVGTGSHPGHKHDFETVVVWFTPPEDAGTRYFCEEGNERVPSASEIMMGVSGARQAAEHAAKQAYLAKQLKVLGVSYSAHGWFANSHSAEKHLLATDLINGTHAPVQNTYTNGWFDMATKAGDTHSLTFGKDVLKNPDIRSKVSLIEYDKMPWDAQRALEDSDWGSAVCGICDHSLRNTLERAFMGFSNQHPSLPHFKPELFKSP